VEALAVECLRCGTTRLARRDEWHRLESPECSRCGYLGWAPMLELTEAERGHLREHPVEERRLRPVA
jgi:ribosomal protein S27AE